MSAKQPPPPQISLMNLFIFNSSYGPKEGEEHKKILFYYPAETGEDTKIRNVGLSEAVIKFAETFEPSNPCDSLHTQKTRQIFYQPEKEFWMVMTISVPFLQKTKDGQVYLEYHGDDIQDNVYLAVLKQSYQMFKLFMGPFRVLLTNIAGVQFLRQRLEHFYSRYLPTLRLNSVDILDVFQGIQFLPLDKNNFLKIQYFVNHLEASFSQIKYVAFLYNDQLVWSGLEQEDIQIMYKYLTTSLFPAYLETELHAGSAASPMRNNISQVNVSHYGKFITGPPNMNDTSSPGKVPRVFMNADYSCDECHLLVYRALNATVCIMVDVTFQLNFEFYKKLDSFLGQQLTSLASEIGEQYNKRGSGAFADTQFKYIYFNHMNLAQKSTIHLDNKRCGNVSVPLEIMNLMAEINADLSRNGPSAEIIVNTATDSWVVGKFSDQREFYVVLNQKHANLVEVNDELKKLCATQFSNIFILD